MTQAQSFAVAVAIVVLSFTLLAPRIAHPSEPTVILSQSVTLTDVDYTWQANLTLNKGDQVDVKVSTSNQPVDLRITQECADHVVLYDEEGQTFYDYRWTVAEYGPYVFSLIADVGNVDATVTITKA